MKKLGNKFRVETKALYLSDYEKLLSSLGLNCEATIIGIDGCSDAGKTTLGKTLSKNSRGQLVDADDFLHKDRKVFVEALKLDELKTAIEAALSSGKPVFISSVCLLDVLSRINVEPDLIVYVERRSSKDVPGDLDIFDYEQGENTNLANFRELDREIALYHRAFKPRTVANIIFLRQD